MKIVDGFSGKRKFFKGRGKSGTHTLDEYQLLLLRAEQTNGFEHERKQNPLSNKELKRLGYKVPKGRK